MKVERVTAVVAVKVELSSETAAALYNDIYAVMRDRGVMSAHDRRPGEFAALFALYDALYSEAGVDGT